MQERKIIIRVNKGMDVEIKGRFTNIELVGIFNYYKEVVLREMLKNDDEQCDKKFKQKKG